MLGEFVEEPKTKDKYKEFLDDLKELENTYNGNTTYSAPLNNSKFLVALFEN